MPDGARKGGDAQQPESVRPRRCGNDVDVSIIRRPYLERSAMPYVRLYVKARRPLYGPFVGHYQLQDHCRFVGALHGSGEDFREQRVAL